MTKNINKTELIDHLKNTQLNLNNFVRYEAFITSSFDLAGKGLDHVTDPAFPEKLNEQDLADLLQEWSDVIYQCKSMIVGLSDRLYENDTYLKGLQASLEYSLDLLENGGDLDD